MTVHDCHFTLQRPLLLPQHLELSISVLIPTKVRIQLGVGHLERAEVSVGLRFLLISLPVKKGVSIVILEVGPGCKLTLSVMVLK